jgi:hypothetical protein
MQESIAQQIHQAAQALLAPGIKLEEVLASTLNRFLTWPFRTSAAYITDTEGTTTEPFPIMIYTSSQHEAPPDPIHVHADTVACVFHLVNTLTVEELHIAYEKIATVKRLKRTPLPQVEFARTDAPLSIVFAVDSREPLEKVAEQMMLINKTHPSSEWPDMVVILTRGTVNYAVQFEGDPIAGDFLLPSLTDFPVMAMYVHIVGHSLGLFSLNKVCSLVFMQLQVFSPGTTLPDQKTDLEGVSPFRITLGAYQFNLKRQLVPVPEEMYVDRGSSLRYLPLRIEDRKGKLLSHLRFIPWQDGGAIRVIGRLPLEGILVFLGPLARNAQAIKRSDGAISSVLPIGEAQFREMVNRFQRQSNMVVKPEQPKFTISKIADEGTSSPFIARLSLGLIKLRDVALHDHTKHEAFDKAYEFVFMTAMNIRATSQKIAEMFAEHECKIFAGEIARLQGYMIHIDESIDRELRKHVEDFLNSAVRLLKQGMQNVAKILQLNIGFLFQKDSAFENGVTALATTHPKLAVYLRETRKWSEHLISSRNAIEHEGWVLPRVVYTEHAGRIHTAEPHISSQPVTAFVQYMMDRLCCFIEDVTVYALQAQMPDGVSLTEIPLAQRNPQCIERFQVALVHGGMPLWSIAYHESTFEET